MRVSSKTKKNENQKEDGDPLHLSEELFKKDSKDFNNLVFYFHSGKIKQRIEKDIDLPTSEDIKFDEAVKLHFLLLGEGNEKANANVKSFIKNLKDRLRRIKTETKREHVETRGEVRGRINWNRTFSRRYQENPKDRTLFVCDNPRINYGINENLVLKKVIWILDQIFQGHPKIFEEGSKWSKFYKGKAKELHNILEKNVYIDRIKDGKKIEIDDRMLKETEQSRRKIYREAAEIYKAYQNRLKYTLESILRDTLIEPERNDVKKRSMLYEIFVLFKIINLFDKEEVDWEVKRKLIRNNGDPAAILEKDGKENIELYYNVSKSQDDDDVVIFKEDKIAKKIIEENIIENSLLEDEQREKFDLSDNLKNKLIRTSKNYSERLSYKIRNKKFSPSGKKPDVWLLDKNKINSDKENSILIFEVKYSNKKSTITSGLGEAIEYALEASDGEKSIFEETEFPENKSDRILKNSENEVGLVVGQDGDFRKEDLPRKAGKEFRVLLFSNPEEDDTNLSEEVSNTISDIIMRKFFD